MTTLPTTGGRTPTPRPTLLALAAGYVSGYLAAAGDLTQASLAGALTGVLAWLAQP